MNTRRNVWQQKDTILKAMCIKVSQAKFRILLLSMYYNTHTNMIIADMLNAQMDFLLNE
jgi:hypothetical protein